MLAWEALERAEAEATGRQELYFEPLIWQLRGTLYLQEKDAAQAEACWRKGLLAARRQKARLWELRLAAALSRLWQELGRAAAAVPLLTGVLHWFEAEENVPELRAARSLCTALSS